MQEKNTIGETGLQFFGTISAAISHDLKNTLAVINENAGLLEDFSLMAAKGMPLDPERIQSIAGKIRNQIRLSDDIVKNLNRFAHSVDERKKTVDVEEMILFVARLSRRLAAVRGVDLQPERSEKSVNLNTDPFYLEALIFRCIDTALASPGPDGTLRMTAERRDRQVVIRFAGLAADAAGSFPAERDHALLDLLRAEAEIDLDPPEGVLRLRLTE